MKKVIEVEITDIDVTKEYYSFEYTIKCEGFIDAEGSYEGDYCNGMTPKEWKECLLEGEALKLVIQAEL